MAVDPKVILLDIEGTTTPISFVKEILFPYSLERVDEYLKEFWDDDGVRNLVEEFQKQCDVDILNGVPGVVRIKTLDEESASSGPNEEFRLSVVANIKWQIQMDMKRTALKSLQGKIWNTGFQKGELRGQVFDDVPEAMKRFTQNGRKVCIYSSGSVEAQKLLFRYSESGDLSPYISNYFDTNIGPKGEPHSYTTIASILGVKPSEILFLTDVPNEAIAARSALVEAILVVRPGNVPLSSKDRESFKICENFAGLK